VTLSDDNNPVIYTEKQSAWKKDIDREQFKLLKERIKAREYNKLIVWDLDRLYRNRKQLITFFKFCKIYKVQVLSYRQAWLNELTIIPEPFNEIMFDMMLQVMGWLAEEESAKKSARVRAAVVKKEGKKTKSRAGNKWGRPSLHTNKKRIVWQLRDTGMSMRRIAKETKLGLGTVSRICSENPQDKLLPKTPLK